MAVQKIDTFKNIILGTLQEFFSVEKNYKDIGFRWYQDPVTTEIVIADNYPLISEIINKRPAIILQRGPLSPIPGMNQYMFWDKVFQKYNCCILNQGSASLGCIGREGLVSENLAEVVKGILEGYNETFIQRGLQRLDNISLGIETPISLPPNNSMVLTPVMFSYVISDTWSRQTYSDHDDEEIIGIDKDSGIILFDLKEDE